LVGQLKLQEVRTEYKIWTGKVYFLCNELAIWLSGTNNGKAGIKKEMTGLREEFYSRRYGILYGED